MKRVETFVKSEGDKMDYNVGVDDKASDIANTWMKAAGEGGIPMSFVIGKDGKIAWMGHAQGLDAVLAQALPRRGTSTSRRPESAERPRSRAVRPVKEAMESKQFAEGAGVDGQDRGRATFDEPVLSIRSVHGSCPHELRQDAGDDCSDIEGLGRRDRRLSDDVFGVRHAAGSDSAGL